MTMPAVREDAETSPRYVIRRRDFRVKKSPPRREAGAAVIKSWAMGWGLTLRDCGTI